MNKYRPIATVYETTDYSMFKTMLGNRAVSASRVAKIKNSIEAVGFRLVPILVNGNFEIIDGQGRLQALKELGLPVQFVIDENAGIKECAALNIGQENWGLNDWVRSYADQGRTPYQVLVSLHEKYGNFIGLHSIIAICEGVVEGHSSDDRVKSGAFTLAAPREELERVCDEVYKFACFKAIIPGAIPRFITVLVWAARTGSIKLQLLHDKLALYGHKLTPFTNTRECLDSLEFVYNFRTKNHVYFEPLYDAYIQTKSPSAASRVKSGGYKRK